jgi:hypothetical protein
LRKLIVIGVVLAALAAADGVVKSWVESQIESRARIEAGAGASASAQIKSFPFLGKLAVIGSAGDITLTLRNVAGERITYSRLAFSLVDVRLDRAKLFQRKAEITSIDKATITVAFSAAELSKRIGFPVSFADGKVRATVRGQAVAAVPTVTAEGSVRLAVSGLPAVNIPIPRTRLLTCAVARVEVAGGELRASCSVEEVPPALIKAASRAVSG